MRHSSPAPTPQDSAQFLDVLKEADAIQVHELSHTESVNQLESALRQFDASGDSGQKAYFVTVRQKPAPEPTSPEPVKPEEDYLLENAQLLLKGGEFILARNLFSYVLKTNLKEPSALKGLGTCLFKLGQTASAKKCFKALYEIHGRHDALFGLALCYVSEKQDTLAVTYLKKIPAENNLSDSERFELYKELGNCQTRCGSFNDAAIAYAAALDLQPTSDIVYVNMGTLEIQRSRLDRALNAFRQAIELNPRNAKAFCGFGLVAVQKGDSAAAVDAFHKTLDLDPLNVVALFQLLSLTDHPTQHPKLTLRLRTYLESDPKNLEVRYALAVLSFKEGHWTLCEKELDLILKSDAGHSKARKLKEELSQNKHQSR